MGEPNCKDSKWRIDRFVQSLSIVGLDLARETAQEQGCELGSTFAFLNVDNLNNYAANYYGQSLQSYRPRSDLQDLQFRNRIKHFVASKADLIFKLRGKEKLRSGIDYNVDTAQEAYSVFATQLPSLETGMQVSNVARRAQIFELLKIGDIILGKVVGKRPFGIFVRILSLVHGRNLDFKNIDIQALCRKSELESDHKSREHLDPIDDFDIDDVVQGVICSISKDEERIAISFCSEKLPSEYGNIELGVIEDFDETTLRSTSFDDNLDYSDCLKRDPGFSNPTNVQTLIDVLGVDCSPPNSLLRSCQRWRFNFEEADNLRKQQSKKWSMDTTATGVGSFKNGDHERALKYFNHALQIYEGNSEALIARGALYANQNKLEYAIKDFKEALILHPGHHNASKYLKETLFEKALRLKDIGNIKEAIDTFEEILELDPNNSESQELLTELKSVLSAKLVEEANKSRKAEGLLRENQKTFEHVRKLIKSDPDVLKRSQKKKRKKKKRLKKVKSKKRKRRRSKVLSESTNTASEEGSYSHRSDDDDDDEWVEKKKSFNSPRKGEGHASEESVEDRAMLSNICAKSVDFIPQSNLFQNAKTSIKDRTFESCSSISNVHAQHGSGDSVESMDKTRRCLSGAGMSGDVENFRRREGVGWEQDGRIKGLRSRTRSISGNDSSSSDRTKKRRSPYRSKNNSMERTGYSHRNRSASSSDNSGRNQTRKRNDGFSRTRVIRGQRSMSRDSRGRRGSRMYRRRRRSARRDSRGQRSTSRDSRERRSSSRSSRGRSSLSRDNRGRRSSSKDSRGRRSSSRNSRGQRSSSRGRRSSSMDSRGKRSSSRGSRGRWSGNKDSKERLVASGGSRRRASWDRKR